MAYETFTLERSGPIVTVSFNRPAKLNPLNEQVLREFLAITYELQEDEDSRVVVLTGKGRSFSVGADMNAAHQRVAGPKHEQGASKHPADFICPERWRQEQFPGDDLVNHRDNDGDQQDAGYASDLQVGDIDEPDDLAHPASHVLRSFADLPGTSFSNQLVSDIQVIGVRRIGHRIILHGVVPACARHSSRRRLPA